MSPLSSFKFHVSCFMIISSSCSLFNGNRTDQEPIARCYDSYLYESDILNIIPNGISYQDSITLVKGYIDDWILQRLILHKAELNITDISLNLRIEKQLQDYRNSLINYAYMKELIRQKLDTVVTNKEIEDCSDNNMRNFGKEDDIRNIILNRRKLSLVEETEKSIYQDALAKNGFEIYSKK